MNLLEAHNDFVQSHNTYFRALLENKVLQIEAIETTSDLFHRQYEEGMADMKKQVLDILNS